MNITDFCDKHSACADGRAWALEQGVETMAELWELQMRANWRIWIATRDGVLTPQERVMWSCRCVRRIWHRLDDERSRTAVEVAERWSRGDASDEELATVSRTAAYAAYAAAYAAHAAAYAAATYATYAADAADAAAAYAADAADAADAASDASVAERDWQARELVRMLGNPFRKENEK